PPASKTTAEKSRRVMRRVPIAKPSSQTLTKSMVCPDKCYKQRPAAPALRTGHAPPSCEGCKEWLGGLSRRLKARVDCSCWIVDYPGWRAQSGSAPTGVGGLCLSWPVDLPRGYRFERKIFHSPPWRGRACFLP